MANRKHLKSVSKKEPAVCKGFVTEYESDFDDSKGDEQLSTRCGDVAAAYWEDVTCQKCLELFYRERLIKGT